MIITTVFLDRDGVLNADSPDYILHPEQVRILPGVPDAVRRFTDAGILLFIISNQQAVGKGLMTSRCAEAIFQKVIDGAESAGGKITDHYYCPHRKEENCPCRKPGTGLFEKAEKDHDLKMEESVFIGDGSGDARAAERLGIPFYLVKQGWWKKTKAYCYEKGISYTLVRDLSAAAEEILKIDQERTK
ncbi:MAG: HAD-IIIA family hydrolase [Candidatus Marinimicrobia bacterium]|nr:HAD-IIIA family hydrolase [Candidatus Neomarinimicrobiota bacterium]